MGADRGQAVATKAAAVPTGKPHRPSSPARHALACKTDSDCVVILSELIKDPKRAWIGQPQAAAEYANGHAVLCYRALRRTLSCRDLRLATRDLEVAAGRLRTMLRPRKCQRPRLCAGCRG